MPPWKSNSGKYTKWRPWVGWLLIIVVFVLAVLTFFGVPFVSVAGHKGVM